MKCVGQGAALSGVAGHHLPGADQPGALYMQVVLGEAPCPLCILQRYALLLIAVLRLSGAASHQGRDHAV